MMRLGRRRRRVASDSATLSAVSPDLGDIYAGTPLLLTGTNLSGVTGVTIGGAACTSVVATATTVTCIAPAKAAGTYDVVATGTGITATLTAAYEAWHPTTTYAAARVYQADQGVTSASSATRHRTGHQSTDIMVGATYEATRFSGAVIASGGNLACDGQGFVELASGRFLLAGGAPGGHADHAVNTIWYSDDRGQTWAVLLADALASSTRPAPAHTFGFFTLTISSVEYVYWLGSDPFTPSGDVFRSADGGSTWTRISTACPTSGLAIYLYGTIGTDIYVGGGQTEIGDSNTVSKTMWKSTDYGVTWAVVVGGDCPATVYGTQCGPMPVKDSCLWVAGSARYHSSVNNFSNAVYKFDGATWTEVLADGHAQFPKSRYHSVVVDAAGKLWRFNGTTWDGATLVPDTKTAHYSSDGATWTAATFPFPWGNTHAQAAIASSDGIYLTEGFQSAKLYVIREHTGALVSAWTDLGSAAKNLAQATDAKKPVLDTAAFGAQPGLAFTLAQALKLAAPDRDTANGNYEVFVVGKTLNFDSSRNEGPNAPQTIVGAANGSTWNNFGLKADDLQYVEYSAGYKTHNPLTSGLADDEVRIIGVTHKTGDIRFWVTMAQVGSTITTSTFDTTYTGWDCVGAGYDTSGAEDDYAAIVIGAVVVVKTSATASDATFKTKLRKWAAKWGALQS